MHFQSLFLVVVALLTTLGLSLPTGQLERSLVTDIETRDLQAPEERQVIATIAALISIAEAVDAAINSIEQGDAAVEGAFTQSTVQQFLESYPGYNIVVFHDQDSTYDLVDYVHGHYELPINAGLTTYGYEILAFPSGNSGWFQRAGDGGFQQWSYGGCTSGTSADGSYVTFC